VSRGIAVITASATKRLQTLGPVAQQAVEELRRELADNPRLGGAYLGIEGFSPAQRHNRRAGK
jgi:hypothetical protein